jgi:hypothetical protein
MRMLSYVQVNHYCVVLYKVVTCVDANKKLRLTLKTALIVDLILSNIILYLSDARW